MLFVTTSAKKSLLLLALGTALTPALACGPDFPQQLVANRTQSLTELPEPVFASEIRALAMKIAALPVPEKTFTNQYDWSTDKTISATSQAEQQLLKVEEALLVAQMRQQTTVEAALAIGAPLSNELKLYTAAAVAFQQQDFSLAETLLRQVLALPSAEQQQRRSWALYSLARVLQKTNNNVAAETEALALYQQLQQEVAAGLADPLQLAVASLGEQARIYKNNGDWQQAIGLYAAQAGYQESGRASLLQLSRELLQMPDAALKPLLTQPAVPQLLSRYLFTQASSLKYSDPALVSRLLTLLSAEADIRLANATALAAISYQQGDFALVRQLLTYAEPEPLFYWLSAKMAVRDNNLAEAAQAYAKAAQSFPAALPEPALKADPYAAVPISEQLQRNMAATQCRIQAEAGVLQLQRGDYLAAMQLLYQAGGEYWQDSAYIAERVLTTQELQTFVDAQVPPGKVKAESQWNYFGDTEPSTLLRNLLARRLMREGQYQQAQSYFVDPKLQQLANDYQQADSQSEPGTFASMTQRFGLDMGRIDNAKALFQLATISRQHGLELLGYEMAPDYQVFYGQFEFYQPEPTTTPAIPDAEQQRVLQSAAKPEKRFHYRYLAAEFANEAASLVPANSQAFAATLCHASTWLINSDPALATQYYRRYLNEGPYVSWGRDFGIRCPAPDFAGAKNRLSQNNQQYWRHELRQAKPWLVPAVGFVLLALALVIWRRKRG
ncbi:hypothetical protein [Rheinheimera sp.]|uniref:hypothetical protein n=1 Tax=Rheinheimera sp. TaxID=1869214 RepID=UPI0027B8AAA1|nr:hypothetical protein [Rheinheimera sp.]